MWLVQSYLGLSLVLCKIVFFTKYLYIYILLIYMAHAPRHRVVVESSSTPVLLLHRIIIIRILRSPELGVHPKNATCTHSCVPA